MKKVHIKNILIIFILYYFGCNVAPTGYVKISSRSEEKIYKKYDEFKNITWYQHSSLFSHYNSLIGLKSPINVYYGIQNKGDSVEKTLRCKFVYVGSSWIFFDTVTIINSNGGKKLWTLKTYDKITNVNTTELLTEVYESCDIFLAESDAQELYNIVSKSGKVKLRLSGKYYEDNEISEEQKTAIKSMIKQVYNF